MKAEEEMKRLGAEFKVALQCACALYSTKEPLCV